MPDFLNTAVSGLRAFQRSLATTGHNIANVNTPNYSRQRVDLVATLPQQVENGQFVGTGVKVAGVKRVYDGFLDQQVRTHSASFGQLETLDRLIKHIGSLMADTQAGLPHALQKFFGAVQDVADSPSSVPARQVMLSEAESLASQFRDMHRQLADLRGNVNQGLRDSVEQINALAEAIAKVNRDITLAGGLGGSPNDLLDQRDALLEDLAQWVAVQAVPQSDGALNVYIGAGQALVVGQVVNHLEVGRSAFDQQDVEIRYKGQPSGTDLSTQLSGGRVGGYLTFRREVLDPAQSTLGLMARGLADTFNAQHGEGMDLAGNLGKDFFQAGEPRVLSHVNNTGGAALTAMIADAGALELSDYEVSYDGAQYHVRRLSDNQLVASGAGPFSNLDGLDISINGSANSGDRYLIQPTRVGADTFRVTLGNTSEIAAAAPILAQLDNQNRGNGRISTGEILDATNGHLRNTVQIKFTAPNTFDIIDLDNPANNLSGQIYTSGANIDINGWRVQITGNPESGDVFEVKDNIGGVGDNRNALALGGLQLQKLLLKDANGEGTSDYQGVYTQIVAEVGARGSRAETNLRSQEALLDQAREARESVSGVNLDEEAADMLRLQQAYQASAQMIQVASHLFDTLLGMVRR